MSTIDQYSIMLKPSVLSGWMWFIMLDHCDVDDTSDMVSTGTAADYDTASKQAFQTMQELKKREKS